MKNIQHRVLPLLSFLLLLSVLTSCSHPKAQQSSYPFCSFSSEQLHDILTMSPERFAKKFNCTVEEQASTYDTFVTNLSIQFEDETWRLGFNTTKDGTICDVVYLRAWRNSEEATELPEYMCRTDAPLAESLRTFYTAEDAIRAAGTVKDSYPHLPSDIAVTEQLLEQTAEGISSSFFFSSFGPYQLDEDVWVTGNLQYTTSESQCTGWTVLTFSNYDRLDNRGLHNSTN